MQTWSTQLLEPLARKHDHIDRTPSRQTETSVQHCYGVPTDSRSVHRSLIANMKVQVKWQKETYDVEIDTSQPPVMFKQQLFSLTGVPSDRQKIMVKGGMLKDDADWAKVAVKDGQKLMMMGTADKVPEAPKESVFLEDLPESEQDIDGFAKYGAGLQNLGNTCYMNSTLQCLYAVPELKTALQSYTAASGGPDPNAKLTEAAKGLFSDLTKSAQAVHPLRFLLMLRERFPQFAETNRQGQYSQQDAEECWTQLVFTLRETVKVSGFDFQLVYIATAALLVANDTCWLLRTLLACY